MSKDDYRGSLVRARGVPPYVRSTRGLVIFPASPGVVAMVKLLLRLFGDFLPAASLRYRVFKLKSIRSLKGEREPGRRRQGRGKGMLRSRLSAEAAPLSPPGLSRGSLRASEQSSLTTTLRRRGNVRVGARDVSRTLRGSAGLLQRGFGVCRSQEVRKARSALARHWQCFD